MIIKILILFRVQGLKQCGRRVTPEIRSHFVDLIQAEHRIIIPHLLQGLDNLTRHSADIGSSMPPYLSFIPDAAKGNTGKGSAGGRSY